MPSHKCGAALAKESSLIVNQHACFFTTCGFIYFHCNFLPQIGSYIRPACMSCSKDSHEDIIYKRLTFKEEIDFRNLFLDDWFGDRSGDGKNIRSSDFNLFSSFEPA